MLVSIAMVSIPVSEDVSLFALHVHGEIMSAELMHVLPCDTRFWYSPPSCRRETVMVSIVLRREIHVVWQAWKTSIGPCRGLWLGSIPPYYGVVTPPFKALLS